MELWQLNIIVVLVIALTTKKDMAVIASAIMILGWLVTLGDYSQAQASLLFCGLNSLLAIIAAAYNHVRHCNLSILTSIFATLATLANLIQMYDASILPSIMTAALGWLLALALTLMDGDKGLVNGFMGDLRATIGRIVYSLSHYYNNKGSH